MRCPKCRYIAFDNGDRCRNCGYQFSLSADVEPLDLPIQTGDEPEGPLGELTIAEHRELASSRSQSSSSSSVASVGSVTPSFDLPLFGDGTHDDRPLVSATAVPRTPLSVRKAAPAAPAVRAAQRRGLPQEPELDLEPAEEPPAPEPIPARRRAPVPVDRSAAVEVDAPPAASSGRRMLAALIDLIVIGSIDAAVLHFTLQICGLGYPELSLLPKAPFVAFLLLLNGGYFASFTAAGGQTIGKMISGVKVIAGDFEAWSERVPLGQAVLRAAAYLVSALPAGLGFLPALLAADKRAVHDRLAHTRVVKA